MAEGGDKLNDEAASSTKDEPFIKVSNRRKRKKDEMEGMDTGGKAKRPNFPPVSAENLMVNKKEPRVFHFDVFILLSSFFNF